MTDEADIRINVHRQLGERGYVAAVEVQGEEWPTVGSGGTERLALFDLARTLSRTIEMLTRTREEDAENSLSYEHLLGDLKVRALAIENHKPDEAWAVDGKLISLHCRACRQPWPCGTEQTLQRVYTGPYSPLLSALDRCSHGRHAKDSCYSCPDDQSSGNLYLNPGLRIGTTLYGEAITVPLDMEDRREPARWIQDDGDFK